MQRGRGFKAKYRPMKSDSDYYMYLAGGPLSWGPIPSGKLKNLMDVDKWSSLCQSLLIRGDVSCNIALTLK